MIEKDRSKRIVALSLPIIGGMVSQNILNLVDTAMVGSLGNAALAALGLGGFATFMLSALLTALGNGVQSAASRRKGEGKTSVIAAPLNAALIITMILAPIWSLVFYNLVDPLYPFLNSDPEVIRLGTDYLQIRIIGITFMTMNYCFRGHWNATDNSHVYMRTLIIMHITNIVLNYFLIYGSFGAPKLGVYGAGLATTLSIALGSILYWLKAIKLAIHQGFLKTLPSAVEIKNQLKVSLNVGVTQFFFAAGLTSLYWIIGQIGTPELAAANVLINVTLVAILPAIGFGISAATLVGQSLGKNEPNDAEKWGWDVVRMGAVVIGLIGLPMLLVPHYIIPIFVKDPQTLAIAQHPMMLSGMFLTIDAIGLILMNAMQGAGYARVPMYTSITLQWFLYLPLCYLLGPILGFGLIGVWICHILYRTLQSAAMVIIWKKGYWKLAKV